MVVVSRGLSSSLPLFDEPVTPLSHASAKQSFVGAKGYVYRRLDGTTSSKERQARISEFNSDRAGVFVFLISTRGGIEKEGGVVEGGRAGGRGVEREIYIKPLHAFHLLH